MKNLYETIRQHSNMILLVVVIVFFGWSVGFDIVKATNPAIGKVTDEVVSALVGDVIDARIQPIQAALERIENKLSTENDYSVILMSIEMNGFRTAEEVDKRIDFLEENKWNSQLAAMKYLSQNADAREALQRRIVYDEVYKALFMRIMRY